MKENNQTNAGGAEKCFACVFLCREAGVYYCPFAGCINKSGALTACRMGK